MKFDTSEMRKPGISPLHVLRVMHYAYAHEASMAKTSIAKAVADCEEQGFNPTAVNVAVAIYQLYMLFRYLGMTWWHGFYKAWRSHAIHYDDPVIPFLYLDFLGEKKRTEELRDAFEDFVVMRRCFPTEPVFTALALCAAATLQVVGSPVDEERVIAIIEEEKRV